MFYCIGLETTKDVNGNSRKLLCVYTTDGALIDVINIVCPYTNYDTVMEQAGYNYPLSDWIVLEKVNVTASEYRKFKKTATKIV